MESTGFTHHPLSDGASFWSGSLPEELIPDEAGFEALWSLHPERYHRITMHGREVETPRWQQAYGADYHYTGRVNRARPITPAMRPLLSWAREQIDARLNGILFNWYDAAQAHYIGKHRDSTKGLMEGSPIVTISLGEARVFRLRPWRGKGFTDFEAPSGQVFVMPWATNQRWTHEVPHFARYSGRRISVTLRAFTEALA